MDQELKQLRQKSLFVVQEDGSNSDEEDVPEANTDKEDVPEEDTDEEDVPEADTDEEEATENV